MGMIGGVLRSSLRHTSRVCKWLTVSLLFFGTSIAADAPRCPELAPDQQRELVRAARTLFEAVKGKEVEKIIALLADEVQIATDVVVPKGRLAQEFRRKRGFTYIYLFDTLRYRREVQKWHVSPHGSVPPGKSVRDLFKEAGNVDIYSCPMGSENDVWHDAEGKVFVSVSFVWPGRPPLMELENCMFVLTRQGWRIMALFSAT